MLSILLPESDESMLEILFVVILRNITIFLLQKHIFLLARKILGLS